MSERPPRDGPVPVRDGPAAPDDRPVLPDRAPDDTDLGWGGRGGGDERDDEWYERERPPHW